MTAIKQANDARHRLVSFGGLDLRKNNFMFSDRTEAGIQLAARLKKFKHQPGVVLAVPRGGIPVAYEVAKVLDMPLDIVLTKKIGHPANREYAIGAVSLNDYFVLPHEGIPQSYIDHEIETIRERLKEMHRLFMGGKASESLAGKTVIVIDDGIATGNTLLGMVNMLRKENPLKIVVAAPVASRSAFHRLLKVVDELIVLLIPDQFHGVGGFYDHFDQVSDEEAIRILNRWKKEQVYFS